MLERSMVRAPIGGMYKTVQALSLPVPERKEQPHTEEFWGKKRNARKKEPSVR